MRKCRGEGGAFPANFRGDFTGRVGRTKLGTTHTCSVLVADKRRLCARTYLSPSLPSPSDTMFNIWESQDRKVDTYKTVRQRGRVGEVGHGSGQERRGWWSVVRRADGGGAQVIEFLYERLSPSPFASV